MSELYTDFLPDFLDALLKVLDSHDYLIKGGQAIQYHLGSMNKAQDARFSKDIDFSFSSESFPLEIEEFKSQLISTYNSKKDNPYLITSENFEINKLPKSDDLYFGLRLSLNVRKRKENGSTGKKLYFKDIESLAIIVDFTVNEVVEDPYIIETKNHIKIAAIPLIIAEKYRAICWQLEEFRSNGVKNPRPKDFYDIFILYNVHYKRKISKINLKLIKTAMHKCFSIKKMDINLINSISGERVKAFHSQNFKEQVLDTLSHNSFFHDITFEQVYNDTLELLDLINEA